MINYRIATAADSAAIAQFHTSSWQRHYRGMLSEKYLDRQAETERLETWEKRMNDPSAEQYVVLAEDGDELCGFACVYLDYDQEWGALLDNLHVRHGWKKQGIGRSLMRRTAEWVYLQKPDSKYHLYVLAGNEDAIKFYDRLGGRNVKTILFTMPDGGPQPSHLYVWEDCRTLFGP